MTKQRANLRGENEERAGLMKVVEGPNANLIARAKEILARLEGSQVKLETAGSDASAQMALFGLPDDRLRKRLGALETSNMTPIEALNILHQLSEEAKKPQ